MEKNLESTILTHLASIGIIEDSAFMAGNLKIEHSELVGLLKSLSLDNFVLLTQLEKKQWVLTEEGRQYKDLGTPEYRLLQQIPAMGITKEELTVIYNEISFYFYYLNNNL